MAVAFASDLSPASAFVIEELTGERRVLSLLGRALPYRPIELTGAMRATSAFYAGNPIGTLQVLGSQEEPSTVGGFWKDRFIRQFSSDGRVVNADGFAMLGSPGAGEGGAVAVADVASLVALVDDFRRKGQLVEVRWDRHVRRGIIRKLVQRWHNPHDCEWELAFDWISQGEEDVPPVLVDVDMVDVAGRLAEDARAVQESALQQEGGLLAGFRNFLSVANDFVESVTSPVEEIVATAQAANDTAAAGVRALSDDAPSEMIALLEGAVAQPGILIATCQRAGRNILQEDAAAVTLAKSVAADVYLRGMVRSARSARATALEQRLRLQIAVGTPGAVAQVRVREGEDLRTISTRFYGTPNEWRRILQFNPGLSGAGVPAGTLVLVPPASRAARAAPGRS